MERQFTIISLDNPNTSFQCRSYERFHYEKNFIGNEHMHPFAEIFFVTEGKGFFHLKNKKVPIQRGTIVINNRDVAHTESSHPDFELEYAVLCVDDLTIQSQKSIHEQTFFFDFSKKYETIFDFIRKIEWEWMIREQFWQCALHTYFNEYIIYILRKSNLFGMNIPSKSSANPLSKVHLHLTSHYADDISLDKLADMFCIYKYYLSHSFKKIYGETVMQILHHIRCEKARDMLQNTDYTIGQVAIGVGYNSSSHFAKIYGKIYGETPTETRQNFIKSPK